jgi:lanosterol synthase
MSQDFVYDKKQNPNSGDKVYRRQCESAPLKVDIETQDIASLLPNAVVKTQDIASLRGSGSANVNIIQAADAARAGINFYQTLQTADGCWPGDYGGPMFLLPGLIIASYITESPFSAPEATMMCRYMLNHQHDDGGWGLHLEGASTLFGTVLQYVSLRILGMKADDENIIRARKWIHDNGVATGIPSWGKFYLSILGVYEWKGCNSLFPEMWLLPQSLPIHPSRYWCHTRMVYLPMAYCYGHKLVARETTLTAELRGELYTEEYKTIDWIAARNRCAETDLYYPQSATLRNLNGLLNIYERIHSKRMRAKALDFIIDYINAEDQQTNYINIGPVNQAINSICIYHAYGRDSEQYRKHRARWTDYLWVAEDGMKMQGYNGSQLWDTTFALQAVMEGGFEKEFPRLAARAYDYIDQSQILSEVPDREKFFRHIQVGGWPFSTVEHGWPITDCTAEGLKTALIANRDTAPERLYQAVNVILSYQNKDGGWASYENTRAPEWLELLNPSEVFGGIMIDYSYTECSSACIQSLLRFQTKYPEHRKPEIQKSIEKGIEFILRQQCPDGSWYGSWAVCYTYGTWFGVEALSLYIQVNSETVMREKVQTAIKKAVQFLLSKQNEDGGWGESFESCVQKKYIPAATSQIVQTAWALMTLITGGSEDQAAVDRGIKLILSRQEKNGDWPQENISGVFNHNCMITYSSYRNVFPIWALSRYIRSGEKV